MLVPAYRSSRPAGVKGCLEVAVNGNWITLTSTPLPGMAIIFRGHLQCGIEPTHKLDELDSDRVANLLQLEQVQPPRPGLVLAYERLRAAERTGNIGLVKPFFLSNCAEQ